MINCIGYTHLKCTHNLLMRIFLYSMIGFVAVAVFFLYDISNVNPFTVSIFFVASLKMLLITFYYFNFYNRIFGCSIAAINSVCFVYYRVLIHWDVENNLLKKTQKELRTRILLCYCFCVSYNSCTSSQAIDFSATVIYLSLVLGPYSCFVYLFCPFEHTHI